MARSSRNARPKTVRRCFFPLPFFRHRFSADATPCSRDEKKGTEKICAQVKNYARSRRADSSLFAARERSQSLTPAPCRRNDQLTLYRESATCIARKRMNYRWKYKLSVNCSKSFIHIDTSLMSRHTETKCFRCVIRGLEQWPSFAVIVHSGRSI